MADIEAGCSTLVRKPLRGLIHKHRLLGKALISLSSRFLPRAISRRLRAFAEQVAFKVRPEYQHETLPPIFHYWAAKYLAPEAQRLGIHSPEQFYFEEICDASRALGAPLRVLSLGSGACAMEIALARRLRDAGVAAYITCVDFNAELRRNPRLPEALPRQWVLPFTIAISCRIR